MRVISFSRRISMIVIALTAGGTALAHHRTSAFDTSREVELEGKITRYEWANPHVFIWLETLDEQGTPVTWRVEGGPPALLRREALTGMSFRSASTSKCLAIPAAHLTDTRH